MKRTTIILSVTIAVCAVSAGYLLNSRLSGEVSSAISPLSASQSDSDHSLSYWSFEDPEGAERHMTEWAGKLLVVNFWATWCSPCRKEIPGFIALQDQFTNEKVQFIGIALDRAEAVREYSLEQKINYPLLVGEDNVAQYMRALGNNIGALPFSAIIAPDGRVVETHQGEWSQEEVDKVLRAAL